MSTDWNSVFGNLRGSPFDPANDPNGIPQEIGARGGNVAPHGWLADGSVTADTIEANAVTTDKLAANAVTAGKIAADSITANEIAAGAINTSELAANAVTAAKIQANTITASEIAASTITANELASNSVTTAKIVAANVTTGKIELVLSAHRYGSNDGASGTPGVFFSSNSGAGLYYALGSGLFLDGGSGFLLAKDGSSENRSSGQFVPNLNNTYRLGSSTNKWTEVWAVNGTIQTSDRRLKRDIADEPLGLRFVRELRPVVYRWKKTVDTQAQEQADAAVDPNAIAREGKKHRARIEKLTAQIYAGGDEAKLLAKIEQERAAIREIIARHSAPARQAEHATRPGRRFHHGFIAQEVKHVLDDAGIDAAFWREDQVTGEQSLKYEELIAPLVRAVQELADRVDRLEN